MAIQAAEPALGDDLKALAAELGLPFHDTVEPNAELYDVLPPEVAAHLGVAPLSLVDGVLLVAISDPLNLTVESRLTSITGLRIALAVAPAETISSGLKRSESSRRVLDNVSDAFKLGLVREDREGDTEIVDLNTLQDQSGVIQLANSILMAALQRQASDVHIEVGSDRVDLKYRIDGVLYPATQPLALKHHAELVSRIKVMADLDIAERRIPQDGRFRLSIDGRDVDFRISILPTQFGEDAVIRILDKSAMSRYGGKLSLSDLGLPDEDIARVRTAVSAPYGLVLVTGPTGSGKTTTLYGALSELAGGAEKIITIEDPIEYQLNDVVQIAVNTKKGMTFASGLRAILRHDPDRIMVGEIRDFETATIAVQAALTGHMVLASVHANSSFDVISRFAHWGIDLHDFVAALNDVFSQRLLRRLCTDCARQIGSVSGPDYAPAGCETCFQTGYRGRIAAIEHLKITPELGDLMIERASAARLRDLATGQGAVPLRTAALALAAKGVTSMAEVERTTFAT